MLKRNRSLMILVALVIFITSIPLNFVEAEKAPERYNEWAGKGLIDSMTFDKTEILDGEKIEVNVAFSEKDKSIEEGDTLTFTFPVRKIAGDGDDYLLLEGYSNSIDIKANNAGEDIIIGKFNITKTQAVLTFNKEAEKFNNLKGELTFTLGGRNFDQRNPSEESIETIRTNLYTGNDVEELDISIKRPVAGSEGVFYYTTGKIDENNSNFLNWYVNINLYRTLDIGSDVVIKGTLDGERKNQRFIEDSLTVIMDDKIYNYKEFNENGLGKIIIDDSNSFTARIYEDTIRGNTARIEYRSRILKAGKNQLYKNITEVELKDSLGIDYKIDEYLRKAEVVGIDTGGQGSGDLDKHRGKLIIKKVDRNDKSKLLEGAKFSLKDDKDKIKHDNLVTDSNGEIVIDDIKGGIYYLEELEAPEGYLKIKNDIELILDFEDGNKKEIEKVVRNRFNHNEYKINFLDEDGEKIANTYKKAGKNGDTIDLKEISDEKIDKNKYEFKTIREHKDVDGNILTMDIESENKEIDIEYRTKTSYLIKYVDEDFKDIKDPKIIERKDDKPLFYKDIISVGEEDIEEIEKYRHKGLYADKKITNSTNDISREPIEKGEELNLSKDKYYNTIYMVYESDIEEYTVRLIDMEANPIKDGNGEDIVVDIKAIVGEEIDIYKIVEDKGYGQKEIEKIENDSRLIENGSLKVEKNPKDREILVTIRANENLEDYFIRFGYKDNKDRFIPFTLSDKSLASFRYQGRLGDYLEVTAPEELGSYRIHNTDDLTIRTRIKAGGKTIIDFIYDIGGDENPEIPTIDIKSKIEKISFSIEYVDEEGNKLFEDDFITGVKGSSFDLSAKKKQSYISPSNIIYKLEKNDDRVSFIYKKERGTGGEIIDPGKPINPTDREYEIVLVDINGKIVLDKEKNPIVITIRANPGDEINYRTELNKKYGKDYIDRFDFDEKIVLGEGARIEVTLNKKLAELDRLNHIQYIQGYPDNTVRPESDISREEVAAVFFRLLDSDYREDIRTSSHDFNDFSKGRWSSKHIGTIVNAGIMTGYEDGSFRPKDAVTRGELAAVISRFENLEPSGKDKFNDIANHWARDYINSAAEKGWIKGYEDGSFRPDQSITRAEFVTMVNNLLNRKVRKDKLLDNLKSYRDLKDEDKWYYTALREALHSHDYEDKRLEDGSEIWTELTNPTIEM